MARANGDAPPHQQPRQHSLSVSADPVAIVAMHQVHSAGVNSSAELEQPVIRIAIPIDYQRDGPGFTFLDGDGVSPSSRNGRQWHVGTRQFAEDTAPPADMWRDWAI